MIAANDLWKSYGSEEVLCGVSLEVAAGETLILLGPNGAGKSTLIACLAGMLRPDSGSVEVHGESVYTSLRSPATREKIATIGLMLQSHSLFYPSLSLWENLELYRSLYSGVCETRDVDGVLREFGIENAREKTEDELSGGMLQRAKLARAFISNPKILLLDEPTAYLDSSGVEKMLEILKGTSGSARVIATHDKAFADSLAGRALVMSDGRLRDA